MVAVFLKEEGKVIGIDQSYEEEYPYLDKYITILSIILKEVKNLNNIDIEVNLVKYGKLGSELLLDYRLHHEKINFNSIEKLNGIAIYYVELNGNYLLEEYKEQKICYIQLQKIFTINMIQIAFHEFHHFSDPFIPHEWQNIRENGRSDLNFEKTIKAYIRIGLNEYYANLYAFSKCLDLISKVNNSLFEIYNKPLIEKIPLYLSNLSKELNEFITFLKKGKLNNLTIQNPKAELIQFLWSKFFKEIYYFLGGWKVINDRKLNTSLIQMAWDNLINEIQEIGLNDMTNLLELFQKLMLRNFESKDEIVESVELLFLEYYREKLDSDFS